MVTAGKVSVFPVFLDRFASEELISNLFSSLLLFDFGEEEPRPDNDVLNFLSFSRFNS